MFVFLDVIIAARSSMQSINVPWTRSPKLRRLLFTERRMRGKRSNRNGLFAEI